MKSYPDRYYIQRKLKPYVRIQSQKKIIYMPDGLKLQELQQSQIDCLVNDYGFTIMIEIPVETYSYCSVFGSLGIMATQIDFIDKKFFELRPGNKVIQIGTGKVTAKNHIDKFSQPYRYAGAIKYENTTYYAFEVPKELLPDKPQTFYMLYQKESVLVFRTVLKTQKRKCFFPIFKKVIDN